MTGKPRAAATGSYQQTLSCMHIHTHVFTRTGEMTGKPRAAATGLAGPDALRQPWGNPDTSVTGNGLLRNGPAVAESLRRRAGSPDPSVTSVTDETDVTGQRGARGAVPASPGISPFDGAWGRVTGMAELSQESAVLPTAFKTATPPPFAAASPGGRQLIAEVCVCVCVCARVCM